MGETMHKINGNNITLTRGDTLEVKVALYRNGAEYTPDAGDVIRFAMKENYEQAQPLLNITIPNDTLILHIRPQDTKNLAFGAYVYDVEITMTDGTVDTFIAEASFIISPEVH